MSDTPDFGFGKFVPGFEFLQKLTQGATQNITQMPQIGSWVAPTLSVEELDKRIAELKTVQFWLDQNAVALKATIQALEVQKMTLSTLKNMNFSMGDLAEAFKIKVPEAAAPAPAPTAAPAPQPAPEAAAPTGVVDPMQWWGALTQQFQQIAASALKEAASHPAMETTQTMAQEALKTATDVATSMTRAAVETVNAAQSAAQSAAEAATEAAKNATEAATQAAAQASVRKTAPRKAAASGKAATPAPARKAAAPAADKSTATPARKSKSSKG